VTVGPTPFIQQLLAFLFSLTIYHGFWVRHQLGVGPYNDKSLEVVSTVLRGTGLHRGPHLSAPLSASPLTPSSSRCGLSHKRPSSIRLSAIGPVKISLVSDTAKVRVPLLPPCKLESSWTAIRVDERMGNVLPIGSGKVCN